VRRDWSVVAKETQKKVLGAILKDGSKEKAIKIVKEMVELLRSGKVPMEKLVIETQLKKDPNKYEIVSPESAAALKANKRGGVNGQRLGRGALVSFIITRAGSSVSEKAEIIEFAKDYDANYYIDHQVLPSVLRILNELGVTEDDLKLKGKQTGLDGFF
jgi:DNA polymerase, archaea type